MIRHLPPAEILGRMLDLGFELQFDVANGQLHIDPTPPEPIVAYLESRSGDLFAALREHFGPRVSGSVPLSQARDVVATRTALAIVQRETER